MTTVARTRPDDAILLRSDADGVSTLTLNRPAARNALTLDLMAAVEAELAAIRDARAVKVVAIAGAAPAFCAGHAPPAFRPAPAPPFYHRTFAPPSPTPPAHAPPPQ